MLFDKNGRLHIQNNEDIELLLVNGLNLDEITNLINNKIDLDKIKLNLPDKYTFDNFKIKILEMIKNLDNKYKIRALHELIMFEYTNLTDIAVIVWYIVDYLQTNNTIYGVGRGSSCSVYVFYLLDLHKVDCVEYDISFEEFFKKGLPIA